MMRAFCERCEETVWVPGENLIESCQCRHCGNVLVLLEDQERRSTRRMSPRDPDTAAFLAMARQLSGEEEEGETPTESLVRDEERPSAAPPRPAPAPPSSEEMGPSSTGGRRSTRLLRGQAAAGEVEPLPSFDGGDTLEVDKLARAHPEADRAPPLDTGDEPLRDQTDRYQAESLLDLPAVEVSGTSGRGSRSYDRDDFIRDGDDETGVLATTAGRRAVPEPSPDDEDTAAYPREERRERDTAPLARVEPEELEDDDTAALQTLPRRGEVERPTRPMDRERAPQDPDRPPDGGGRLFGSEDLDWAALLDSNLPELEIPDEDAKHVIIRLPSSAALQTDSDVAKLEELYSLKGVLQPFMDPPAAHRDAETKTFLPHRLVGADNDPPTAKLTGHDDAPTINYAASAPERPSSQLETQNWSESEARQVPPPPPPSRVVEKFRAEDLAPTLVCARSPGSLEAERFLQLYQRLASRNGESPRLILVTSPLPSEGKTTVAANLALVAARVPDRGALLVDADSRGEGVLKFFGIPGKPEGLLETLRAGEGDPRRHVCQFNLGSLDVLPLGLQGSDAAQLLSSQAMADTLEFLRSSYPRASVVIDGPPVLTSASPLVLARHVDGVLLVVRKGKTRRKAVRRALEMLPRDKVLGIVLNDS
jgi:protein-tyrosine kinase